MARRIKQEPITVTLHTGEPIRAILENRQEHKAYWREGKVYEAITGHIRILNLDTGGEEVYDVIRFDYLVTHDPDSPRRVDLICSLDFVAVHYGVPFHLLQLAAGLNG